MTVGVRVSQRAAALGRLLAAAAVALGIGGIAGVLLWQGMRDRHLPSVLLGLSVLGTEYVGLRLAIGSALHPAVPFVRRLGARQAGVGEYGESKQALLLASKLVGTEKLPPLYVVESPTVNAFVTGRSYERIAGVTTGFSVLPVEQQRAVFVTLLAQTQTRKGIAEALSSALGSPLSPVPKEGVRADFSRSMTYYRECDTAGAEILGADVVFLEQALRAAYSTPGSIRPATPAVAEAFFVWPCGDAVTPQEDRLERERLQALVGFVERGAGKES